MVVTQEVQKAVGQEVGHLVDEWAASCLGLTKGRVERDDDVAQEARRAVWAGLRVHRKREHVGRLRFAAMLSIERLDVRVVSQKDAQLTLRDAEILEHALRAGAEATLIQARCAARVSRDERGHAFDYSFGIFFASSRNFARPMSVSGCLTSCPMTLNGIVQMSAPITAACTTCTGWRTLATSTSVA
jgi:hypothetical protein